MDANNIHHARGRLLLVLALLITAGSGCALRPVTPYDNIEKGLLLTAAGGQIYDYATTTSKLNEGCIESNPLLGEHPSDATLAASKALVVAVTYFGANAIRNHAVRKVYLGVISAIGIAAGVHNEQVDCR